jgi:hypothetical protein
MSDPADRPKFREHLREIGQALGGIGKDVELGATNAPRAAKEGARNAMAKAAGIRRTPLKEWSDADSK